MPDVKPEVLEAAGKQLRSVCGKIDQIFAQRDPPSPQEWSAIYGREVKSILDAAHYQLVDDKHVVVPIEPTRERLERGLEGTDPAFRERDIEIRRHIYLITTAPEENEDGTDSRARA